MRTCKDCNKTKPLQDFTVNRRCAQGRSNTCKKCSNAYHRAWRAQNPRSHRASVKRWRESNRERVNEYKRQYSKTAKAQATAQEWERLNRHKRQLQRAIWEVENKARRREQWNTWAAQNRVRIVHKQHERRVREHGLSPMLTLDARERILKRAQGVCYYCGKSGGKMSLDHVMPLVLGGPHSEGNVVAACMGCNASKKNQLLVVWRYTRFRCWFDN